MGGFLTILTLSSRCTDAYSWAWQSTKTLISSAGLCQLQALNPLVLLSISAKRMTTDPSARIYGIMQVFGLRLGNSAKHCKHEVYNLQQLESQLSQQLTMEISCTKTSRARAAKSTTLLVCRRATGKFWSILLSIPSYSTCQSTVSKGVDAMSLPTVLT